MQHEELFTYATPEIAEVIEKHRILRGASQLNVTLGHEATAENVDEFLTEMNTLSNKYDSFSDIEKANAEIAFLRARISRICKLGKYKLNDSITQDVSDLKREIFSLSDLVGINMNESIRFMEAKRTGQKNVVYKDS